MAVTAFAKGIKHLDGPFRDGPAAASTTCYRRAIVMRDSSGNLKNGATASGCFGVGVAAFNDGMFQSAGTNPDVWDNSSGSAGDIRIKYETGIWGPFANSSSSITAGMEGKACYIVDNVTVHATSNSGARSPAGIIHRVDSTGVYVEFCEDDIRAAAAVSSINGSTYTQTYSTANRTVAAPTATAPAAATVVTQTAFTADNGGGTADGTIDSQAAPAALTDSSGGVSGGNTIGAIADNGGSATTASTAAAVATLAAKIAEYRTLATTAQNNLKEVSAKVANLITAVNALAADRAADVTQITALVADDLDNRQSITAIIDDLQAATIVG